MKPTPVLDAWNEEIERQVDAAHEAAVTMRLE